MGPKEEPDTETNWSTDCRPQDELQLQRLRLLGHSTVNRLGESQEGKQGSALLQSKQLEHQAKRYGEGQKPDHAPSAQANRMRRLLDRHSL
jgi:hypothetical protein